MYILAAQKKDGREFYYTGKAGEAFASTNLNEAFKYESQEVAKAKMLHFNNYSIMHGHWFHVKEIVDDL